MGIVFKFFDNPHIPPKPPHLLMHSNQLRDQSNSGNPKDPIHLNFKDKLVGNRDPLNFSLGHLDPNSSPMEILEGELVYSSDELSDKQTLSVPITKEDKQRIYLPWKYSLIIKLHGKRILHQTLKQKIQALWKIKENFPLIDLGNGYYTSSCMDHGLFLASFYQSNTGNLILLQKMQSKAIQQFG